MLVIGLVFCFAIGAIPCWIQRGRINSFLFWGCNNLFTAALLKVFIGEMNYTLIESFDDIGVYTFQHYFLPFLVIDILGVFVGKKILKDKLQLFQNHYVSVVFVCAIICAVLFFRLENIMLVATAVISFLFSIILTKRDYQVFTKECYWGNLKKGLPYLAVYIVTAIIYIPAEFSVYNYKDIGITVPELFISQLIMISGLALLICAGLFFFNDISFRILMLFLLLVGVGGYIQGNFLNGRLEILDGREPQEWELGTCILNILIWMVVFTLLVVLYTYRKKWLKYLCIYLCAVQLLSITYILFTVERPGLEGGYELTSEEFMNVGSEKNIVVFVLDWFDGQILDEILEESPDFLQPLHDFTWYPNCTSKYAFTDMSVPYLLTGVEWEQGMSEAEYSKYAHENGTLLPQIHEQGYGIEIYTQTRQASNLPVTWIDNARTTVEASKNRIAISAMLHKSCMYKISPFAMKALYRYNGEEFLSSISTGAADNIYFVGSGGQEEFYSFLNEKSLHVTDRPYYFKFIHLVGVHPEYCFDENMEYSTNATAVSQGKATLKLVYRFMEQLREIGLYDNSTIVITADHGQNYFNREELMKKCGYEATSSPIMFVKLAHQVSDDMFISNAPVSHAQIIPTILSEIGIQDTGKTFQDIKENENLLREMIFVRNPDIPYTRYVIDGNVQDVNSWRIE